MIKIKSIVTVALLLLIQFGLAQRLITGKVLDSQTGEALIGASILVVGTTTGAVTDTEGNFSLQVPAGSDALEISYAGFESHILKLAEGVNNYSVSMQIGKILDEIVVTGYATERKVDLTGSVAVVELGPIKNNASGNPMQALQGRVAGLYIEKNGGSPTGENSRILIRGSNTLGNTDPLYIIDGVPTKRPEVFQSLSPGSIESIQILKDASAASIYGSRASNGVIIVTTKSGRSASGEQLSISLNSNLSILNSKPQHFDMLNAIERGQALWRGAVNDRTNPNSALYTFDWNGDFNNPVLNKVSVNPFVGGDTRVPAGNTNWQDESYQSAQLYTNDITIAGGTKNSSLMVNLSQVKNTGILKFTNYERYAARINADAHFFNNKIRVGASSEIVTSNERLAAVDLGNSPVPNLAVTLAPTLPVFRTDGVYAGPVGAGYSDRNNPVNMQFLNRWDNRNRSFAFGNVFAEIEPIKNLIFRSMAGLDYSKIYTKNIELAFQEGFLGRNVNSLTNINQDQTSLTFTNTLRYQIQHKKSTINLLAGIEAIKTDLVEFTAFKEGFSSQTLDFFFLDAGTGRTTANGRGTGNRLLSQFGKINYSLADRYLASVTMRRDGSSRFGKENKYGFFPAVTLGWRLSNEQFMKSIRSISELKIRAGFGIVGNQDIGDVARFGLYEPRYGTLFNNGVGNPGQWLNVGSAYDLSGIDQGTLPSGFVSVQGENLALKWEQTEEINIGVDFGLFSDKVYGSFDYFTRVTSDILLQPPIAAAVGDGQLKWLNGATKENKGFEIVLGIRNKIGNLSYNVTGNMAHFKDKITKLPPEVRTAYPGNVEKSIVGHSQLSLFGYKNDGIFKTQSEVDAHATQVGKGLGRIKFIDLNKDGIINALDQDWLGTILPAFEYGLRVDLEFKQLDLSLFGSGIAGRSGVDPNNALNNRLFVNQNNSKGVLLEAWHRQNTTGNRPMLSLVDANNEGRSSDFFIVNTSYFKMRNVQLGYSLPANSLSKFRVGSLRLYLMGDNLFWMKSKEYDGPDPELNNINTIPVPTSYSVGLNVTFK